MLYQSAEPKPLYGNHFAYQIDSESAYGTVIVTYGSTRKINFLDKSSGESVSSGQRIAWNQ